MGLVIIKLYFYGMKRFKLDRDYGFFDQDIRLRKYPFVSLFRFSEHWQAAEIHIQKKAIGKYLVPLRVVGRTRLAERTLNGFPLKVRELFHYLE